MKSLTVQIYKSHGQYRWRIKHRNGNNVANGGEGYKRKHDCERGAQRLALALSNGDFTVEHV